MPYEKDTVETKTEMSNYRISTCYLRGFVATFAIFFLYHDYNVINCAFQNKLDSRLWFKMSVTFICLKKNITLDWMLRLVMFKH